MLLVRERREVYFYGNVGLQRAICPKCKEWCIITKDDRTPCCGIEMEFDDTPPRWYRPSTTNYKRRPVRIGNKRRMLLMQDFRCAYCGKEFGSIVLRDGEEVYLSIEFDHYIPFAFNQDNRPTNFLAACQVCNGLKANLHFKDIEQAREYLKQRRKEKGYDF